MSRDAPGATGAPGRGASKARHRTRVREGQRVQRLRRGLRVRAGGCRRPTRLAAHHSRAYQTAAGRWQLRRPLEAPGRSPSGRPQTTCDGAR
eukprot:scaffold10402_cov96-Isochrysis_galbana.AAC.3